MEPELQRQLLLEDTNFITIRHQIKSLMAKNYLKNPTISLDEIAFLVGYSDSTAFNRAFKSWTGMTVAHYRKNIPS